MKEEFCFCVGYFENSYVCRKANLSLNPSMVFALTPSCTPQLYILSWFVYSLLCFTKHVYSICRCCSCMIYDISLIVHAIYMIIHCTLSYFLFISHLCCLLQSCIISFLLPRVQLYIMVKHSVVLIWYRGWLGVKTQFYLSWSIVYSFQNKTKNSPSLRRGLDVKQL